jgi:hypothetical protein
VASGDFYFLVAAPGNAPPRRVNAAAYHLRYDVLNSRQVDFFRADGGAFYATVRYSACPRELELRLMYRPNPTLHAPLDGGDANPAPPPLPACTSTSAVAPAMSTDDFCAIFLATCGTSHAGYTTWTECRATYAALSATPNRRTCQSYHVCNATLNPTAAQIHCTHAAGEAVCMMSN